MLQGDDQDGGWVRTRRCMECGVEGSRPGGGLRKPEGGRKGLLGMWIEQGDAVEWIVVDGAG